MWTNYLKIAFRNLRRQKGYALINILGLAVGLATCLVIGYYIQHELSYDRFHTNADRLYRVTRGNYAITPPGTQQLLADNFPEIENVTFVDSRGERLLSTGNEPLYIEEVLKTDHRFFHVFPYRLLRGHPDDVLDGPGKIVLTRSAARRLFDQENPVGQVVTYENSQEYQVSGIVENPPSNTHFRFNALLSLSQKEREARLTGPVRWNFYDGYTYLDLRKNADPQALQAKIDRFTENLDTKYETTLSLQPVTDIHLHATDIGGEIAAQSDIRYLYLFGGIGILILLIACINYMNLATARSARRAWEVGVRKVVGARRGQLIRQFLSEAVLVAVLAAPLAVGLTRVAVPLVEGIMAQELTLYYGQNGVVLAAVLGITLLVGIASGSYPAFFLSVNRPTNVFHSTGGRGRGGFLRQTMVVFQFTASTLLIVASLVVYHQLRYVQQTNLGFDREQIITFDTGVFGDDYRAFTEELQQQPQVRSVTSGPPLGLGRKRMTTSIDEDGSSQDTPRLSVLPVDYDFLETFDLEVLAGRSFARGRTGDVEEAVILNESAVRAYGLGDSPVGRTVEVESDKQRTVIGIVKDFHNPSLRQRIRPLAFTLRPENNYTGIVRLAGDDITTGLAAVRSVWQQFRPDRPFTYQFLSQRIERNYRAEQRLGQMFGIFAGLAIFLACLGLFGLAAFSAQQRTQEIGIRKVLGATVTGIVGLLSKDFLKLVGIALTIAVPVGYILMQRWLENFAYRVHLGPGIFLLTTAVALGIAFLTVSYQSIKAALTNPAESLRYE